MANTQQSKKRVRRNARREEINRSRRSRIRTFVKKVETAVEAGDAKAAHSAFREAEPEVMTGAAKGVLHKNTAARTVARLAKKVHSLEG